MSKRISHADHTTVSLPRAGCYIPHDPSSGTMEKFDAGVIHNLRNALAPRQALVIGGTAGVTVPNVPALGLFDFTIALWLRVAAISGSTAQTLVHGTGACPYMFVTASTGKVEVRNNSGGGSLLQSSALPVNKWVLVALSRTGGTMSYTLNGLADTSVADSTDFSGLITRFGSYGGASEPLGGAVIPLIYNRALSSAEHLSLYEAGAPAAADYNAATNTALYTSDFSAGVDSWLNASGGCTLTGNVDSIGGVDNVMSITTAGSRPSFQRSATTINAYGRYRIAGSIRMDATMFATAIKGIRIDDSANNSAAYQTVAAADTWTAFSFEVSTGRTNVLFEFCGASGGTVNVTTGTFYITGITFTPVGVTLAPDADAPGVGYNWNDMSGNGAHIVLSATGVAWNKPSNGCKHIRGTTNTNGNQQLLAASTLLPANCQITRVRARARTNTPTITIGTASGGSQIVASIALSTTWKDLTIALTGGIVSAADDVWIGSNSTDVVEVDITIEPLSF